MNPDGSGVTRLTSLTSPNVAPAWSPDGSNIAFASYRDGNYEVYVMNADGSSQTRLTNNAASDGFYGVSQSELYYGITWSPDGTQLAFISRRDGNLEIYRMEADGSNQTRLTTTATSDSFPDW
jgi:TolB protein